jgi:hypothetical protein
MFAVEGAQMLRVLFMEATANTAQLEESWDRLCRTLSLVGLNELEFVDLVRPAARAFAEMLLAEVKNDGELTEAEERTMQFVRHRMDLGPETNAYLDREMQRLRVLSHAKLGKLPSLAVSDVGFKAGEIVHLVAPCVYSRVRMRRGIENSEHHRGRLTVTDNRSIFVSDTLSMEVRHQRVVEMTLVSSTAVRIESSAKGSGVYHFDDAEFVYRVYWVAVGRANQTIVDRSITQSTRHIPRDVRQRVWQRYGGRCAECSSDQYLEFDHIVPVARGGSNSDGNVQLLCRRCNGEKSDHI